MKEHPPQPTDWHRKPKGKTKKACPICAAPANCAGEHRATRPDEGHARRWVRRVPTPEGERIIEVGEPWQRTRKTRIHINAREKLGKAARMLARGHTWRETADTLDTGLAGLWRLKQRHLKLFQHDYRQELERIEAEEAEKPAVKLERAPQYPIERTFEIPDKELSGPQGMSLIQFVKEVYIPARMVLTEGAIEQLSIAVRLFQRWAGGQLRIGDLSENLIRGFLSDLAKTRAPATVNRKRKALVGLWRCAYDEGTLDRPPRKIRGLPEEPDLPEAWTLEEVSRILAEARNERGDICGLPSPPIGGSPFCSLFMIQERGSGPFAR